MDGRRLEGRGRAAGYGVSVAVPANRRTAPEGLPASPSGCHELQRMGVWNVDGCCERCHSPERFAVFGSVGPCTTLVSSAPVRCCCEAKKTAERGIGP